MATVSKNPLAKFSQRFTFDAAPVRLWSVSLDKPRARDYGGGKLSVPMFWADIIVARTHPQYKEFQSVLVDMAKKSFETTKDVSFPVSDGDDIVEAQKEKGRDCSFLKDAVLVRAVSKQYAPILRYVSSTGVITVDDTMRDMVASKFYWGVHAGVEVNLVPYQGTRAVPNTISCYLTEVTSTGVGDRLGGGDPNKKWGRLVKSLGEINDKDPTEGLEDDIKL